MRDCKENIKWLRKYFKELKRNVDVVVFENLGEI